MAYQGETLTLPLPGSEGKPLKLILDPPRREIPVYLAALGPRNLELCGEIADGVLPWLFAPEHADSVLRPLRVAAERAGRDSAEIAVCPSVFTRIDEDPDRARELVRPILALYIGGMGSRRRNFYRRLVASYGYERLTLEVQDAYLAGRKVEAAEMLPNELVDTLCLCGGREQINERLAAFRESGVETLIAIPVGLDPEDRLGQLRALAEVAARGGVLEAPAAA